MHKHTMNKLAARPATRFLAVLAAPALLSLAACGGSGGQEQDSAPLAGARIGGHFTLTDENGQTFDSDTLAGNYWTIYFGYTYCPDVCPIDLQKLMQGFHLFEKEHPELAEKVQPLFVTIDPQRDTPDALTQYTDAFHPRLVGLTGSEQDVQQVAEQFLVYRQKREQEGDAEYLMDHSRQTYLFGPDGEPIAMLPVDHRDDGTPSTPEDIATELERWVK